MNKGRLVRQDNKSVNVAVLVYPAQLSEGPGARQVYLVDAMVHPQDERAAGRTDLSLDVKPDVRARQGENRFTTWTAEEVATLKQVAGENHVTAKAASGAEGYVFGATADLRSSNSIGTPGSQSIYLDSLKPSELSVGPDAEGRSILQQAYAFNDAAARTQAKVAYAKAAVETESRSVDLDDASKPDDHEKEAGN